MVNHNSKNNKLKLLVLIVLCSVIAFLHAQVIEMKDACDVQYKGDPSELNDSTILVPDVAVAVSEKMFVDMPIDTTTAVGGMPSIFFIIDHSSSMYQNPGNDVWGKRFTVSLEFIDSIRVRFPGAEVGLVVFRQHQYFDPADDGRFVQTPGYDTGSYLPFFKLDSSYQNSGGAMGYDIVKQYLLADTVPLGNYVDLQYIPSNKGVNSGTTNINVGFAAAKDAFKNAIYNNNRHFIIFLSDGDATVFNGPAQSLTDYVTQVDGLPTTFSVFFNSAGQVLQNLVNMTTNIQNNGYSTVNPKSNLWTLQVNNLLSLLMNEVMGVIITSTIVVKPTDITVNGNTASDYDTVNHQFTFDNHFPLTGVKTDFVYEINYTITKDSILPNGDTIIVVGDSATSGNFSVVVDTSVTDPPDWYPHEFDMICWQRDLQFYYNNAEINSFNEKMDPIQLRFDWTDGNKYYEYTEADVEVITTSGLATDKEIYTLSLSGTNSFRGTFPRVLIADNQTPTKGDGIVQHYTNDNFIATFRNNESPKLPLDTIRDTIPFELSGSIRILCGYYFDNDANGLVDSIYVEVTADIGGSLTSNHVQEILDSALTLPDFRDFTIMGSGVVSGGFYIDVSEGNTPPTTYVTSDDKLTVKSDILTTGGWVKDTIAPVFDRVAPIIHWEEKAAFLVDYHVDTIADTLGVKFSEPIENVTHEQPFYFLDISPDPDENYTALLGTVSQPAPDSMVFYVKSSSVMYMERGDSLWIHETNRVKDIADNSQNNKKNTRRQLWVKKKMIPYNLNPNSVSPIDITNIHIYMIPQDIINVLINQGILDDLNLQNNSTGNYIGMIIMVVPDPVNIGEFIPDFKLKGNLSIYDAVGNQVVPKSMMGWDEKSKCLVWVWNVKNQNGRNVGAGTYLAFIETQDITPSVNEGKGPKKVFKHFIGVKE